MLPLIFLMFWIGLYPKPFLERMEKSVGKVVRMVNVAQAPQGKRVSAIPKPAAVLKAKEARLAR